MPYREILGGTYDLRWSKGARCYQGSMKLGGHKVQNLTQFCEVMGLALAVDGASVISDAEAEEEEEVSL